MGARILAVVDCFDAVTSDRQYRRALPPSEAMAALKKQAGVLYDSSVVAVLERLLSKSGSSPVPTCSWRKVGSSTKLGIGNASAPEAGLAAEQAGKSSSPLTLIARASQELRVLYELIQVLGPRLSLNEILPALADRLQKLTHFAAISIYLVRDGKLLPRFVDGLNADLLARMQIPLGRGVSGWVAENGKPCLNGNPAVEPGYPGDPARFSALRSAVSVPIDSPEGVLGALTLYSMRQNAFTPDDVRLLKTVAVTAGPFIYHAVIHECVRESGTDRGPVGEKSFGLLAASA